VGARITRTTWERICVNCKRGTIRKKVQLYICFHLLLINKRWADVYETEGKRSGACSIPNFFGIPGLLLNYNGTIKDVFTLAHEVLFFWKFFTMYIQNNIQLGHSINCYYSSKNLPHRYF
jgi:oligoendopeptidase F